MACSSHFQPLSYHFYADDTQLYILFNPEVQSSLQESISLVEICVVDIKIWMSKKMLKLNYEKTELLYITSPYYQKSITQQSLKINQSTIMSSSSARNFGVIFDNCAQMKEQITSICRATYFHLRNIGLIRRYITSDACALLVHSLISTKFDYCNSLLAGIPNYQLNRLQCIQNSAARIVSRRPRHEDIITILIISALVTTSTTD